jgi:hypothetical protein
MRIVVTVTAVVLKGGKSCFGLMARTAGKVSINGQTALIKQSLSQLKAFFCQ